MMVFLGLLLAVKDKIRGLLQNTLLILGISFLYLRTILDVFTEFVHTFLTFLVNLAVIVTYLCLGSVKGLDRAENEGVGARLKEKYVEKLAGMLEETMEQILPSADSQPDQPEQPRHRFSQKIHHYFPKRETREK